MSFFKSSYSKILIWLFGLSFLLLFQERSYSTLTLIPYDTMRNTFAHSADKSSLLYGFQVDSLHVAKGVVKRNQRFIDLLKGYHVAPSVLQQINLLPRKVFDFRKIKVNKKYTLLASPDSSRTIKAVIYEPNLIDYLIFYMEDSLLIEKCQRKVTHVEKSVAGIIKSSLYETIKALNLSPQLTNLFVDIFAWQIDFQRLQKGDLFKLIYEDRIVEGVSIGVDKIKGAYFDHLGNGYCAFPFDQGEGTDYFDDGGNSLRKTLLKYPIEFTRISSRYSRRRFHPISKVFKSHLGIDFVAAIGTPIRSVGSGVIVEARYKVYNGNYVKIRHNNLYSTQYLHMSKIASGIKKGVKVYQGQKIGFVGKTGLATGPHLCYRFWKNKVQVNALNINLPPLHPIKQKYRVAFLKARQEITNRLDSISIMKY